MTISSIAVYRCDRCESVAEIRKEEQARNWAQLYARDVSGDRAISRKDGDAKDICPTCFDEFWTWWTTKKEKNS